VISPVPEPTRSPSPPPTVIAPVPSQTQQHIAQSLERWNDDLAEAVEEVDHGAWREVEEQEEDAWKDEEITGYVQENSNLETVTEETGTGLVAVALYDYQAAAEDELSFDPDEVIINIEMVIITCFLYFKLKRNFFNQLFCFFRLMKVGGVGSVEDR
jgi:cortactin